MVVTVDAIRNLHMQPTTRRQHHESATANPRSYEPPTKPPLGDTMHKHPKQVHCVHSKTQQSPSTPHLDAQLRQYVVCLLQQRAQAVALGCVRQAQVLLVVVAL